MARGLGARRSNELYGGLLGDYLRQAGGLLAERAGEVISGQALGGGGVHQGKIGRQIPPTHPASY